MTLRIEVEQEARQLLRHRLSNLIACPSVIITTLSSVPMNFSDTQLLLDSRREGFLTVLAIQECTGRI